MTSANDSTLLGRVTDRFRSELRRRTRTPRVARARRRAAARLEDLAHRFEGAAYRVAGRQPDPSVDDAVLTQRIRSQLGPLQRRLDVPRLNVTVHDHVARLRGVVGTEAQAATLVEAVRNVSGVEDVRSYLHAGYGPGDTRPSEGRGSPGRSEAWRELLGAVREILDEPTGPSARSVAELLGEDGVTAERLTTAVLASFLDVLPPGEGDHVRSHLPADVRDRLDALVRIGTPPRPRTTDQLVAAVIDACPVRQETAEVAVRQVLATLRELVPEEAADVEAVLPGDLKELWRDPLVVTG